MTPPLARFFCLGRAAEWIRTHARGRVLHVMVLHDDACSMHRCVCAPIYDVRAATVEIMREGSAAQHQWVRETSS